MAVITDKKQIDELLTRGVQDIIVRENLEKKLLSGKKLRIKYGIDPTGPRIHLGRASTMRKLAKLQALGHKIILLVGDFTALIGDASDKTAERPMLTKEQVKDNMKDYLKQIGKIIDIKKTEVRYNSEWLKKLNYYDICNQANAFSVAEMLDRENFSKRYKEGVRISMRELLYPLMQGYDSVALKADIEIGGSDQLFNVLAGRTLQRLHKQEPQDVITFKLMDGTDGRKMSTSWGNVIFINDEPKEVYGKIMSVKDELIVQYYELATDVPMESISEYEKNIKLGTANPRDLKMKLAFEIVKIYHDEKKATEAREHFVKTVQNKEVADEDIVDCKISGTSWKIIDLLVETKLSASKSEARRLIEQGGIKVGGEVEKDFNIIIEPKDGLLIQRGKRQVVRLKLKK